MGGKNKLEIAYEDESLIVVKKPSGLSVNTSKTTINIETLEDILRKMYPGLFKKNIYTRKDEENYLVSIDGNIYNKRDEFISRAGIVHRLDKETSGLIIVAKNVEDFINLQKQFLSKRVDKRYIALTYGKPKDLDVGDTFVVNAPIGRSPRNRTKFAINASGKEAITNFKWLKIFNPDIGEFSLFECIPVTGRTHQIRVHLTAMNMPIVGDKLYSGAKKYLKNIDLFNRQFLHSYSLKFRHPKTNKVIKVEYSIPLDLKKIIESLK